MIQHQKYMCANESEQKLKKYVRETAKNLTRFTIWQVYGLSSDFFLANSMELYC